MVLGKTLDAELIDQFELVDALPDDGRSTEPAAGTSQSSWNNADRLLGMKKIKNNGKKKDMRSWRRFNQVENFDAKEKR